MTTTTGKEEPQGGREPTLSPNKKLVGTRKAVPPAFRVYDMPPEVFSRFISYTKEHAGNKAWVAIDQLLVHANLNKRVDSIEERLSKLEHIADVVPEEIENGCIQ